MENVFVGKGWAEEEGRDIGSASRYQIPIPSSPWTCISKIGGTDLGGPIGIIETCPGVKEQKYPYHEFFIGKAASAQGRDLVRL